jgi:hypothetical protein
LLDRLDHTLLDLFGRHARDLQDDLGLGRRDVGKGVNRQLLPSLQACQSQDDSQQKGE